MLLDGLLISIDPGGQTGWALFWYGTMFACGRVSSEKLMDLPFISDGLSLRGAKVIVEVPIMYDTSRERNPGSIVKNGVLSGEIKGLYRALGADIEEVCPAKKWKGNIPKPGPGEEYIIERRLLKKLTQREKAVLLATISDRAKGLNHNTVDAAAMGRWQTETESDE